ncbi:MAG: ATP-binding cassette domain-containing protein [Acutalibacteraceae bacterium]|nr:ATP-binding cassette domain-containing protein [Acutalibacteraceae bacterium]
MIKLENITFSYKGEKNKIFENFSLDIKKGERVRLVGDSGRGKTTLLRIILGLERVKKGKVKIEENTRFSVVFQEDRLIPFVNVKKNISLFSSEEKAEKLLCELGLGDCAEMSIDELSGGMKRRVALARALSKEFDALILDEAFNGLDEKTLQKVCDVVNAYTENKTVIMVSHHNKEAQLLKVSAEKSVN